MPEDAAGGDNILTDLAVPFPWSALGKQVGLSFLRGPVWQLEL